MQCRTSGLTDHQWCLENNICPSTFYKWINNFSVQVSVSEVNSFSPVRNEVVKVDIVNED